MPKTSSVLQRTIFAALATSLLSACPPAKESGDGGTKKDGSVDISDRDAATPRDATVPKEEAGLRDAAAEAGAKDAGVPDAFVPVVLEPTKPGSDAPTISDLGYYNDTDLGPRILIRGKDLNGDVASYTIKLFNNGAATTYDVGTEEAPDVVSEVTGNITPNPLEATYLAIIDSSADFQKAVDTIKVTVKDQGGRTSAEKTATLTATPVVNAGGACDPIFKRCATGSVCAKASASTANYTCIVNSTARTQACNAALVLQPPTVMSVRGQVNAYSLWDTPPSCGTDSTGEADRVVKLKLTSAASKVTLTTQSDITNFDTVLYYLDKGCGSQPTSCAEAACSCNDEILEPVRIPQSRLVMTNLPAGDHFFVIDTAASQITQSNVFELSVTVE